MIIKTIQIQSESSVNDNYDISNIKNFKVLNKDYFINSIFYLKDQISKNVQMDNYYNLAVAMEEYTDSICITFTSDKQKIREMAVKSIGGLYKKIVQATTEEVIKEVLI